jgi:hypothetical protein
MGARKGVPEQGDRGTAKGRQRMNTREMKKGDQDAIEMIHRKSGIDYQMPDLSGNLVTAVTICEHEDEIVGAIALKIQPETYLWIKPDLDPRLKWDAIRIMQKDILKQAVMLGYRELVAYPPDCVKKFFKRMITLGWRLPRDGWTTWVREVR